MRRMFTQGQSTLEILIAFLIFASSLGAAIAVIFGGQSLSVDSTKANQALRFAREEIEIARASAIGNFADLVSASGTEREFIKERIVETIDAHIKKVTVRVRWMTDPLRDQHITLVTHVTDWRDLGDTGGDTGGGGTTGDWTNPRTLGSINLSPGGNSATDLDVVNKIVYLVSQHSSQASDDFWVIDATNGESPQTLSSTSTGPGLVAVDVAGAYAYAANDSVTAQLHIVDVSDTQTPRLAASFQLPDVSGPGAAGNSVFYASGRVYVGTKSATGPEFHIVDVSAPASPAALGSFEIGADVNEIWVSGSYAYLATSNDNEELKMLDVSDPADILSAGVFNATGTLDGKGLHLAGTTLYLGRAAGSGDELYVLDVSDPASVVILGSNNVGADINGIRVRDELAFLGTSNSNKEFQVWNVADPTNMAEESSFNFPQVAAAVDYEDNLVYVAVRSNDGLRIITSGP